MMCIVRHSAASLYWLCSWNMRPYLVGELLQVYSPSGAAKVSWSPDPHTPQPLTWYTTTFNPVALASGDVLLFNATGLSRGHVFVNGCVCVGVR